MKSLKPFVLVLAGMLITIALFSFKNETPKKEYLSVYCRTTDFLIYKPDQPIEVIKIEKGNSSEVMRINIINNFSKEGWELKEVVAEGSYRDLYFERVKQ